LSDGQYKLLLLTGSPSATHTITLSPNDAQKIYFVRNTTAQSVVFTQGSGGNVTIATGDSGIIYANGAGAGAAIANLTDHFAMSSVNITGGSITGLSDLGLSSAGPFIDFAETDTTDKDARISLSAGTLVFDTRTDADVLVQENMRIASNGNVGIGTAADAATKLEVSSDTNPTAVFIAYISGTTMTVTGITSGALAVGDRVFGANVEWNTVITAQTSGTTGASGDYTVSNSQTVSSNPGISMSSVASGKSVLRLTNTDTTEAAGQTTGGIEFFSSDATTPGAGVKGYVALIAESATPDSAMIFGTSNDTASTLAVERMRIDSTGNVGIGTTTPSYNSAGRGNLTIGGASSAILALQVGGVAKGYTLHDGTNLQLINGAAGSILLGTDGTERSRITSDGRFYVNQTAGNGNTAQRTGVTYDGATEWAIAIKTTSASGNAISFQNSSGTQVGTISTTASATAYNTSSDYRLKENVQPMQDALDTISQLNPVTYTWKVDGSDGQGFIAHELQAVVPDCVTGEKDAVDAEGNPQYQGIDTSFLVATLVKAVQEQQALINALEARLSALETSR
jgi:hypothetical protein